MPVPAAEPRTNGSLVARSCCLGLVLLALISCTESPELLELSTGTREISGKEVHAYRQLLAEGEYFHLVVEQHGADVVVELFGPGRDASLLRVDGLTADQGTEEVVWVAERSGDYRLEIRGLTDEAGRYGLGGVEVRSASARDRQRATAARVYADASLRLQAGDRASWLAAADRYEDARALWEELGDRPGQARALFLLGLVYSDMLGQTDEAIRYYAEALTLFEATGDTWQQASTLHKLGWIYHQSLGDMERALANYRQALDLWEVGSPRQKAQVTNNIGFAYRILGEFEMALDFYDKALEQWLTIGDRSEQATVLQNRGRCYFYLGDYQRALDDLHRALNIREELGLRDRTAGPLNAIGQVHALQGDLETALGFFQRALELRREAGNRRGQAVTLSSLGSIYTELGRDDEALAAFDQALPIFRDFRDLRQEATVLRYTGWLLGPSDPRSLDYFRQSLALFEEFRELNGQAQALHGITLAEREQGRLTAALEHSGRALELIEELRARPATPALRASYFSTMAELHDVRIDLLMERHERHPDRGYDAEALAASEWGRARSQLDALIESSVRLTLDTDSALSERQDELEEKINARELQRLQLLEDRASPDRIASVERGSRELLREYDKVRGQVLRSSPRYSALAPPQRLEAADVQRLLDADTLLLEYKLGERRSFVWAVTRDTIASFELPGRERIEHVARRAYQRLSANKRESRGPTRVALAELSEMLLAPVEELLGQRRLLIVREGALQYIPFAVLSVPGSPEEGLLADHEINYMPSVSTLDALRRRLADRAEASGLVAVVADPVFQVYDPRFSAQLGTTPSGQGTARGGDVADLSHYERLVHSQAEAEAILDLVKLLGPVTPGRSRGLFGFEASRDALTSGELGHYRIVHIATHGDLNAAQPELSRLVLSLVDEDGRQRDGLLHAHEIYGLDLPVELVTLSACSTALGKEVRGEGLVGLTQAFMYAGAARVLVSLWQVDDRATAELMRRFYRHHLLDGESPAAALRAAQLSIARERQWRDPYYWAAFVLQGEW